MSGIQLKLLAVGALAAGVLLPVGAAPGDDDGTLFTRPGGAGDKSAVDSGEGDLNALQLTGISTLGGQSMFNFVDTRNNRSFWVQMKGSTNGYSVESFDAANDTVVVGFGGRSRSLKLREVRIASVPAAVTPAAGSTPVVRPSGMPAGPVVRTTGGAEIANPKTPQEIAQAETEARMLVSDLLEISMQERARQKALREAQLRQQQGGAGTAAATPTGR